MLGSIAKATGRRAARVTGITPLSLPSWRPFSTGHSEEAKRTEMYELHLEAGGKMVNFEGYELPVQYKGQGIVSETQWCRERASLFDVSHMGQVHVTGSGAAALLERLTPTDIQGMEEGEARYSLLLNGDGGIVDDCIITRLPGLFNVVLNAGCKEKDLDFIHRQLNAAKLDGTVEDCDVVHREDQQLVALQGPRAADVLQQLLPVEDLSTMSFMQARNVMLDTGSGLHKAFIVRCGYTGEDGFELSFAPEALQDIVRRIGAHEDVRMTGLGARDALRLEAGLPLYGSDITGQTTPVEAGLNFAISKARRTSGGFLGDEVVLDQISNKSWKRKRVGLAIQGRAPARAGDIIKDSAGEEVGVVTSGSFSPTLSKPIAMGYVFKGFHKRGTELAVELRGGREAQAEVTKMPFVPQKYFKAQ